MNKFFKTSFTIIVILFLCTGQSFGFDVEETQVEALILNELIGDNVITENFDGQVNDNWIFDGGASVNYHGLRTNKCLEISGYGQAFLYNNSF